MGRGRAEHGDKDASSLTTEWRPGTKVATNVRLECLTLQSRSRQSNKLVSATMQTQTAFGSAFEKAPTYWCHARTITSLPNQGMKETSCGSGNYFHQSVSGPEELKGEAMKTIHRP